MGTRLAMKMRRLAERRPEDAETLNALANKLDLTIQSLGVGSGRKSMAAYQMARRCYCRVINRPFDWKAEHDLEEVE